MDSKTADTIIRLRDEHKVEWKDVVKIIGYAESHCAETYRQRKNGRVYKDELIDFARSLPPNTYTRLEIWNLMLEQHPNYEICNRQSFFRWMTLAKVKFRKSYRAIRDGYEQVYKISKARGCSIRSAAKVYFEIEGLPRPTNLNHYAKRVQAYVESKQKEV